MKKMLSGRSDFIFDWIFFKLANDVNRPKISDNFDFSLVSFISMIVTSL